MNPGQEQYVEFRLGRAVKDLDAARSLLKEGHLYQCVGALYYACFHAVSALLLAKGLRSAKHSGVRALFNQHWIKPGVLPENLGRFYQDLYRRRQASDYGDFVEFEKEQVSGWLQDTEHFVDAVKRQTLTEMQQRDSI